MDFHHTTTKLWSNDMPPRHSGKKNTNTFEADPKIQLGSVPVSLMTEEIRDDRPATLTAGIWSAITWGPGITCRDQCNEMPRWENKPLRSTDPRHQAPSNMFAHHALCVLMEAYRAVPTSAASQDMVYTFFTLHWHDRPTPSSPCWRSYELKLRLLASPLISSIVVPYIIPYRSSLTEFRLKYGPFGCQLGFMC